MSCNHVAVCLRRFSLLFLFFSIINIQHMKYDARICFFFCIVFSFFFLPFRLCHSVSVLRLITYRILMWYRYICLASNLDFVMNYIYFLLTFSLLLFCCVMWSLFRWFSLFEITSETVYAWIAWIALFGCFTEDLLKHRSIGTKRIYNRISLSWGWNIIICSITRKLWRSFFRFVVSSRMMSLNLAPHLNAGVKSQTEISLSTCFFLAIETHVYNSGYCIPCLFTCLRFLDSFFCNAMWWPQLLTE